MFFNEVVVWFVFLGIFVLFEECRFDVDGMVDKVEFDDEFEIDDDVIFCVERFVVVICLF